MILVDEAVHNCLNIFDSGTLVLKKPPKNGRLFSKSDLALRPVFYRLRRTGELVEIGFDVDVEGGNDYKMVIKFEGISVERLPAVERRKATKICRNREEHFVTSQWR